MRYYDYAEMKDGKVIKRKKIRTKPIETYNGNYEIKLAELKILDGKEYKNREEIELNYQMILY